MSDKPTELHYIAALRDRIGLADWQAIIDKAIEDAKQGDRAAREWVTQQAIGANRISLIELAARERLGITPDRTIAAEAEAMADTRPRWAFEDEPPTPIGRALSAINAEQQAEIQRQAQAEKDRRRAEREARKAAATATDQGDRNTAKNIN